MGRSGRSPIQGAGDGTGLFLSILWLSLADSRSHRRVGEERKRCEMNWPNKSLQATAAAPSVFDGVGDSPLPGSVVAQFPAAVPELRRWADEQACVRALRRSRGD